MMLSLRRDTGYDYEVYDLDDPNSMPVATFRERWQAYEFMRRYDLTAS